MLTSWVFSFLLLAQRQRSVWVNQEQLKASLKARTPAQLGLNCFHFCLWRVTSLCSVDLFKIKWLRLIPGDSGDTSTPPPPAQFILNAKTIGTVASERPQTPLTATDRWTVSYYLHLINVVVIMKNSHKEPFSYEISLTLNGDMLFV